MANLMQNINYLLNKKRSKYVILVAPSQAPSRTNTTYLLLQTKGNNSSFLGIMNFYSATTLKVIAKLIDALQR